MTDFFAVYAPTELGLVRENFEITGETTDEVIAAAQACAPNAPAGYYLFAIRARWGDIEGDFLWVTGYVWELEKFEKHVNPPAREE